MRLNLNNVAQAQAILQDYNSMRAEYRAWKEWYPDSRKPGRYGTYYLIRARLIDLGNNLSPKAPWQRGEVVALHVQIYMQHVYNHLPMRIRCSV